MTFELDAATWSTPVSPGVRSVELTADCCQQEMPAYSRLLLDVIEGDPILAIRGDEAEELWRIVEPVLTNGNRVQPYFKGSWGPPSAEAFIDRTMLADE